MSYIYILGQYGLAGDERLLLKGPSDGVSLAELDCKRLVMFEEPDPSKSLDQEFLKDLIGGANQTTGRFNFSDKNKITLHCKTVLNANVMTAVALEQAILERLIYFIWKTKFCTSADEVDEANRVFLADEKYKSRQYWDSVVDGIIWLLLNHMLIFRLNNNKLMISDQQKARTRRELLEADLFIKWFEKNFTMLTNTDAHHHKFISQAEIVEQFNLLQPSSITQIIGKRNYQPAKFIKSMMKTHAALASLYKEKITNYRLTEEERMHPDAKNKAGPNCQYIRHVLIRMVSIHEGRSMPADSLMDIAEGSPSEDVDELKSDVPQDYIYDDKLFFIYPPGIRERNDQQQAASNNNQPQQPPRVHLSVDDSQPSGSQLNPDMMMDLIGGGPVSGPRNFVRAGNDEMMDIDDDVGIDADANLIVPPSANAQPGAGGEEDDANDQPGADELKNDDQEIAAANQQQPQQQPQQQLQQQPQQQSQQRPVRRSQRKVNNIARRDNIALRVAGNKIIHPNKRSKKHK